MFSPIAREVESMAENLIEARAAAASEARLRDEGAHIWTAERLAANMQERSGSSRIFVVSNREPYTHVRKAERRFASFPPVDSLRPSSPFCAPVTAYG